LADYGLPALSLISAQAFTSPNSFTVLFAVEEKAAESLSSP
jgi:hypothetical protein